MISYEELKVLADSLLADEALMAINLIKPKINQPNTNSSIIKRDRPIVKCPYCKQATVVKNGKTKAGNQKYICKNCKKSVSDSYNTMVYHSRHGFTEWLKFVHYELLGLTIREIANELKLNKSTVFSWRHKLYSAISEIKKRICLSGTAEIDATFYKINLKGTKPENMPRYSKKNGRSHGNSIMKHKVCVLSGVDEYNNMFFEIVGLGKETKEKLMKVETKICDCTKIICDSNSAIIWWAKENHSNIETIKAYVEHKNSHGYSLNKLNQLHQELRIYLESIKRGVSTRHLQGYLDMFLFMKMIKTINENRDIIAFDKVLSKKTKLYVTEIFKKAMPINLYEAYGEYKYGIYQ